MVVFAEESSKLRKDIASLKSAIRDDGLQQNTVFLLKQLSGSGDIQKNERELLASFLKRANSGSNIYMFLENDRFVSGAFFENVFFLKGTQKNCPKWVVWGG